MSRYNNIAKPPKPELWYYEKRYNASTRSRTTSEFGNDLIIISGSQFMYIEPWEVGFVECTLYMHGTFGSVFSKRFSRQLIPQSFVLGTISIVFVFDGEL
jgi:hypothetical protein